MIGTSWCEATLGGLRFATSLGGDMQTMQPNMGQGVPKWANPQIRKAEAYGHDATGAGTLTSGNVFFAFLLLEKNSDDFDFG